MRITPPQKYIFLLLAWWLISSISPLGSQNYRSIADSLLGRVPHVQTPEEQVDLYNDVAYSYRRFAPDSLLHFAQLALDMAEEHKYERGLMIAHKNIGIYRFKMDSPADSILQAYQSASAYAEKIQDVYQQAALANNIGLVKNTQKKLNEAISYFLKALVILRENDHPASRLESLINGNISKCYRDKKELEKAKFYLEEAFDVATEIRDSSLISIYGDNYGGVLIDMGRVEEGMHYLQDVVPVQKSFSDYQSLCQSYMELSEQYLKLGESQKAEEYILLTEELAKEHGFKTLETGIYLLLAQIKLEQNKPLEAIQHGQRGLTTSNYTDQTFYSSSYYEVLSAAYVALGDYEQAYQMQIRHEELQDQIAQTEKAVLADELEAEYRVEEQRQQINALNTVQVAQNRQLNFVIIIAVLALLLLVAVSSAFISNQRKKEIISQKNNQLKAYIDQNLQLENFVHIASHDLKSPLRNITSFAQLLQRRLSSKENEAVQEYLEFIIKAGDDLSQLVDDLLQYSIVTKNPNELSRLSLIELLKEIESGIQTTINSSKAEIIFDFEIDWIRGDATKLKQLFQNLILNAIKFQHPDNKPIIRISNQDKGQYWEFAVADNGIGIEKEYQNQIFLMLKRLHTNEHFEGTGIGLAICKSVVEQHGGEIWVRSEAGQGSTFYFRLDKQLNQLPRTTSLRAPWPPPATSP